MVSFDVESLFTNVPVHVPIEGATQAALWKLESDPDLADHMTIYEQQDGAAIGSLVSAVIATLYMEIFEKQAIKSAPCKPKIWKH